MKTNKITKALFIIYFILLVWIILFKLSFSLDELPYIKNINLIPFHESVIVNGKIDFSEIIDNIIIFIPFGIFICCFNNKKSFFKKVLPIFCTSLALEILQYIFSIGATDITDLITNTFGGIIGIGIFWGFYKIFKEKTYKIINVISIIVAILAVLLISLLIICNL